jgi:CRISPR-associated protein Cas2
MLIVSYDISVTKIRTKFAKFLKQYGRRLQYSVREIDQSPRVRELILAEIEHNFMKKFANTDSVLLFPVCEWCQSKTVRYGYSITEEDDVVIV